MRTMAPATTILDRMCSDMGLTRQSLGSVFTACAICKQVSNSAWLCGPALSFSISRALGSALWSKLRPLTDELVPGLLFIRAAAIRGSILR